MSNPFGFCCLGGKTRLVFDPNTFFLLCCLLLLPTTFGIICFHCYLNFVGFLCSLSFDSNKFCFLSFFLQITDSFGLFNSFSLHSYMLRPQLSLFLLFNPQSLFSLILFDLNPQQFS